MKPEFEEKEKRALTRLFRANLDVLSDSDCDYICTLIKKEREKVSRIEDFFAREQLEDILNHLQEKIKKSKEKLIKIEDKRREVTKSPFVIRPINPNGSYTGIEAHQITETTVRRIESSIPFPEAVIQVMENKWCSVTEVQSRLDSKLNISRSRNHVYTTLESLLEDKKVQVKWDGKSKIYKREF